LEIKCRNCHESNLERILDFGKMPLAGGFLSSLSEIESEIFYDLEVIICNRCSLIQIPRSIDPKILFSDYSFSSSTIPFLVKHFSDLAIEINERFKPKSFFEIGCNDGILLKPLSELGIDVFGIDAAPNIVSIAKGKGLDVMSGLFNYDVSNKIMEQYGLFDVISASNAFPHNDLPHEILRGVCNLLTEDGILILEIMYCGDLYEQNQWDTLYHEHLNFYSLKSLSSVLLNHGLKIFDLQRLPMHGGSLRVYASKKELAAKNLAAGAAFLVENGKRKEVTTTKSGLQYEVLAKGGDKKYVPAKEGEEDNKQFLVNYRGTLIDGTEFDSSYKRGQPTAFAPTPRGANDHRCELI
jgi:SAM-dependent methyltransferase